MSQKIIINTSLNKIDFIHNSVLISGYDTEAQDIGLTHRQLMILVRKWNVPNTDYIRPCIRRDGWRSSSEELFFEGQRKEKISLKSNLHLDHWRGGRKMTIGLKMGYMAKSMVIGNWFLQTDKKSPNWEIRRYIASDLMEFKI